MGAAPGNDDLADWRSAVAARLVFAGVDAVLKLEEAADAFGIDVIGDRRAAELDGMAENLLESDMEAVEFGAGEPAGLAAGTDTGAEEAFIGIDIAHAGEQRLVEQCGLDGELAAAEESCEFAASDGERLCAGGGEGCAALEIAELEATEAAGIDEADLLAALKA